jgi:hypothetical protein
VIVLNQVQLLVVTTFLKHPIILLKISVLNPNKEAQMNNIIKVETRLWNQNTLLSLELVCELVGEEPPELFDWS